MKVFTLQPTVASVLYCLWYLKIASPPPHHTARRRRRTSKCPGWGTQMSHCWVVETGPS